MIETIYSDPNFLAHHGVKGMKWGVRRYQNKDGSLTDAGRKEYYNSPNHLDLTKSGIREQDRQQKVYNSYRDKVKAQLATDKGFAVVKKMYQESEKRRNAASTNKHGHYSDAQYSDFLKSKEGKEYLKNRDAYNNYVQNTVKKVLKDSYDSPMSELLDYTQKYNKTSFGENLTDTMQKTYLRELYS